MVESLLLPDGGWNLSRLNVLFDKDSVDNILKIFWADKEEEDKLVWMGSHSGFFRVKHVYKYLIDGSLDRMKWWKTLWKSNIHERSKFFLWKMASGGLPTKAEMLRRKWDIEDPQCPHGCASIEDIIHLFFKCSVAKAMWLASPWTIRWDNYQINSLQDYLDLITNPKGKLPVHHEDEEVFFIFATQLFETIWRIRNNLVFEGRMSYLEVESKGVYRRVVEFKNSLITLSRQNNSPPNPHLSWTPPLEGFVKFNTDACMGNGNACLGLVARDFSGKVLKIQVTKVRINSPEAAEAAAILHAVRLAVREGFAKIWCESDAQSVIQSLNNPSSPSVHWSALSFITQTLNLCHNFDSVSFSWTPRKLNQLAHITAKWGMNNDSVGLLSFLTSSQRFVTILYQDSGMIAPHLDS